MKNINNGAEFLNLVFKDMKDTIKSDTSDPSQRIMEYLERLEHSQKEALSDENKRVLLRSFYYDKYLIKKLPESYIKYRKGFFHDLGLADKEEITEQDKALVLGCIKNEQKQSLDNLLDFLSSEENPYPTWFKYYIFQGVTKVGTFYPILGDFTKRSSSTTDPFITIDENVISQMYGLVSKYMSDEELSDEEQYLITTGLNFRNLYSKIYRQNNKKSNIRYGDLFDDEEFEEHIGASIQDDTYLDDIPQEDDGILLPPPEETQKKAGK